MARLRTGSLKGGEEVGGGGFGWVEGGGLEEGEVSRWRKFGPPVEGLRRIRLGIEVGVGGEERDDVSPGGIRREEEGGVRGGIELVDFAAPGAVDEGAVRVVLVCGSREVFEERGIREVTGGVVGETDEEDGGRGIREG